MYPELSLYIDGHWCNGTSGASGAVIDPATGLEFARVPFASASDLDAALDAAERGFRTWRTLLPQQRAAILRRAATLLRERAELVAATITREQGKPLAEARNETLGAAEMVEWLAEEGRRVYGRVIPSRFPGSRIFVMHEPIGPVAAFAPWNFPCMMPARKIAHALAAGCSVVLKPAEETPGTAILVGRIFEDAGVPPGVVNIVFGVPSEVSGHLIASPIIKKVSLTGSVPVGKQIAALASRSLKRVTLELGGHAPVLVFDDVDIDPLIAKLVSARFRNAGQVCTAPTRFCVQERIHDRFLARFREAIAAMRVGDGRDPAMQMGPLSNPRRIDAMIAMVEDARAKGAVVYGGEPLPGSGYFFQPTIVADPTRATMAMTTEPFGPIAAITPIVDAADAIAEANRLPYGLAAYVFTGSQATAMEMAASVEAGAIVVNGLVSTAPEAPFGGLKESGLGQEAGTEGLLGYLNSKTVTETSFMA